jgi:hypothetical protein
MTGTNCDLLNTNSSGHIWTTLYVQKEEKAMLKNEQGLTMSYT